MLAWNQVAADIADRKATRTARTPKGTAISRIPSALERSRASDLLYLDASIDKTTQLDEHFSDLR